MFLRVARSITQATNASMRREISTVGVVGLGSMGHGVAQLCAAAGLEVTAVDTTQAAVDKGVGAIQKSVTMLGGKAVKKGKMTEAEAATSIEDTMGRVKGSTNIEDVASCDLIIEAIIEDMTIKVPFYENLGRIAKPDSIFATNTSSYSVSEMAAASGRPEKMVGLHYFNPVQIMKLVEVISTPESDPAVVAKVMDFVKKTGKTAVSCGDTPGFIVNRLLVPYIVQGIAMVARGDATPEAVDTAMMLGAGHPMGPITLSDYVGNDINLACMKGWKENYPDNPAFEVPEAMALLEEMVADGKLGRKTGQGFYKWEGNKRV
jgi:3-hydroxyacyl-CoA dehydrogenase